MGTDVSETQTAPIYRINDDVLDMTLYLQDTPRPYQLNDIMPSAQSHTNAHKLEFFERSRWGDNRSLQTRICILVTSEIWTPWHLNGWQAHRLHCCRVRHCRSQAAHWTQWMKCDVRHATLFVCGQSASKWRSVSQHGLARRQQAHSRVQRALTCFSGLEGAYITFSTDKQRDLYTFRKLDEVEENLSKFPNPLLQKIL